MSVSKQEFINVRQKCQELDLNVPEGIAILPRNFARARSKDDLVHESSVTTVRKLWKEAGISETRVERDTDKILFISESAAEWIGPTIFIGAGLLSQDPTAASLALNVLSNYLTDWFKGLPGTKTARFNIIVEEDKDRRYCEIAYKGDLDGINEVKKLLHEVGVNWKND